jgi:hypothetical protein
VDKRRRLTCFFGDCADNARGFALPPAENMTAIPASPPEQPPDVMPDLDAREIEIADGIAVWKCEHCEHAHVVLYDENEDAYAEAIVTKTMALDIIASLKGILDIREH